MSDFDSLPRSAKAAFRVARKRAKETAKPCLSEHEFLKLWEASEEKCSITALPFSDEPEMYDPATGYKRLIAYPWQPSLDQIDPGMGYAIENVQLVCKCVNIGKSSYSSETFYRWVEAAADHRRNGEKTT